MLIIFILQQNVSKTYVGKRLKTKDDIQLEMYQPLLPVSFTPLTVKGSEPE